MKTITVAFVNVILAATTFGQPTIYEVDTAPASTGIQIKIKGTGFGSQSPFNGGSCNPIGGSGGTSPYLLIHNSTHNWNYGNSGDIVGVNMTSWNNTEVDIANFTGCYSSYAFSAGDQVYVTVENSSTLQTSSPYYFTLPSGFVISPAINLTGNLAFGGVPVCSNATATLTIHNTGNATLIVSGITYSGNFSPGVFSGNWSGNISAGGSQNVTITFTPTAITPYSGTLGVTCDAPSGGSISISGTGTGTAPTITTPGNLPVGAVGFPYSTNFTATGGTLPYVWAWVSGTLQSGLSLNGNVLSGTPSSAATASFKVKVTGCNGLSSTNQFSLTVETPPTITTSSALPNGTVGQSYGPLTFTVNGGTGSYNWSRASGSLPGGMSLNSSGVLSGTPTNGTTANFSVKVTDAYGFSTTNGFSLTITSPLQISTTSLNRGMVGRNYSDQLYAQGEQQPWTWSVQGLPSGLSLDPYGNGLIDGTPQGPPNTYQVTIDVKDQYGNWAPSKILPLVVSSPLLITTSTTLPNATQYQTYSTNFSAQGGSGSYSWTSGNLPSWLSLSGAGALSGTPTNSGPFSFSVQVGDGGFFTNQTFNLTVNAAPTVATPVISPPSETVTNQSVPVTITDATQVATIYYTVNGNDPTSASTPYSGLFVISQPATGSITVTVKAIGFKTGFNPSAEATATYTIIIPPTGPTITTTSQLSTGTAGTFYGPLTFTATGGTGSYNWSRVSGVLPPGLTLTSGGLLSGTPTNSGTYNFTVQVKDGNNSSDTKAFNLTINPASILSGGLTGRVLGNGSPLANAQVNIQRPAFITASTSTLSDGTFSFSGIPSGNGYVLNVAAAGYNSTNLTGINVPIFNINNVGNIALTSVSGPYTLKEMPNVNPAITTVEQGGTAYRYYCVVNASGNQQGGIPGIPVSVQILNGASIPQNDTNILWPGSVAGVSQGDAYGTVRIAVPSSYLNSNGSVQTIQLSTGGQVQKTFQAQVVPRQYDQVWSQKLGGGISIGELLTAEADSSSESDLRHRIINGSVASECISRIRQDKLEAGVGFKLGASVSLASAEISGGAGLSAGSILSSTFSFDPNSTNSSVNAMKLYTDLGNLLSDPTLNPVGNIIYGFVDSTIAPSFLSSNLRSTEADLEAGPYAQIQANIGVGISNVVQVGVEGGASVSADLTGR